VQKFKKRKELSPMQIGLTTLTGPKFSGKSWLALMLALDVASTDKVLSLGLEEAKHRLAFRVKTLLQSNPAPTHMQYALGRSALTLVDRMKEDYPGTRLLVIDTVDHPKPTLIQQLHTLAHENALSVLLVCRGAIPPGTDVSLSVERRPGKSDGVVPLFNISQQGALVPL
jgi:hypothetical protein